MKSTLCSLAKVLIFLTLLTVKLQARAQLWPFLSPSSISNSLTVDPHGSNIISWQHKNDGTFTHYTSLWLETGDGNYITDFNTGINVFSAGKTVYPPLLLASKLYEPPTHPPTASSILNFNSSNPAPMINSPVLDKPHQIKLFSNTGEIVSGDTMVFAISYRAIDTSLLYRVVFRYNSNGQNSFDRINSPNQTSSIPDYNAATRSPVNSIRNFGGESVSVYNGTPGNNSGYTDGIIFDQIKASGNVLNIFISMRPADNLNLNSTTGLEAELLSRTSSRANWQQVDISKIGSMAILNSHDPNNISVFPQFLSLPQSKQVLHYTINFQNIGGGDADTIKVLFNIPGQMNRAKSISNLGGFCGRFTLIPNFDIDMVNGNIIFKIVHDLQGCRSPLLTNSPESRGQISFDLEIVPGQDPGQPAVLEAWADIYFHTKGIMFSNGFTGQPKLPCYIVNDSAIKAGLFIPGTFEYELPIRTNNAVTVFSKNCGDDDRCNCSRPKGFWQWLHCYWWISVIVLLLFVIWWLYKKRQRQP